MSSESISRIAVLSAYQYRAESLAFTLSQQLNLETIAVAEAAAESPPDASIVLIDLDMGIETALRLTYSITSKQKGTSVVLLGLVESEESVLKLAEVGAGGYVSTVASVADLIAVVRSVQKGEFACRPEITYALFSYLAQLANYDRENILEASVLTTRERQIFRMLSQRFMNKEIAAQLHLSEHTVKNHVHNILKKLGMRNRNLAARRYLAMHVLEHPIPERSMPQSGSSHNVFHHSHEITARPEAREISSSFVEGECFARRAASR